MHRTLAAGLAALVGFTVLAQTPASAVEPHDAGAPPMVLTLAGDGLGSSGPASRVMLPSDVFIDGRADGTLLAHDSQRLMRVDPATDRVTVLPWPTDSGFWVGGDLAVDGGEVVMGADNRIIRFTPGGGPATTLWSGGGPTALDVGADHAVWALAGGRVQRLPLGGVWTALTPVGAIVEGLDLAVSPDGTKAYVLDVGSGHRGVYEVTTAGLGTRVAGNGGNVGAFLAGRQSREVSTVDVTSISTDATTLTMSSPDNAVLQAPLAGGPLTQVSSGACTGRLSQLGADLAVGCNTGPGERSLHRFSVAGVDRGRILGMDPEQPWSPDGVLATDAYLDEVRGSAGTPDGRVVFTTEHGLVREVRSDGTLLTRARLSPLTTGRGKVALGDDGTAYVTTGTGSLTAVSVNGTVSDVAVSADVADVEVLSDGALAVADRAGHRILRVTATGTQTTLTSAIGDPVDLARSGDRLLVAEGGLRWVDADGGVSTVLSGGAPTSVTATVEGPWANVDYQYLGGIAVIAADGSMQPVAAVGGVVAQLQAVGDGSVLRAGGRTVSRILTPGLGASVPPLGVTATPGEGRVSIGWDKPFADGMIVAKRGSTPPHDHWDGVQLPWPTSNPMTVMTIAGEPLVPGEEWSFAFFERGYTTNQAGSAMAMGPPVGVTTAALPDTTPPGQPTDVVLNATHTEISLGFNDPRVDDLAKVLVRYAAGSTPPASVTDGLPFPEDVDGAGWWWGTLPNPVRGQDYAVSIFLMDHQGNVSTWTGLTRLDFEPPAQVMQVSVEPSYQSLRFAYTAPTDADYSGTFYAIGAAGATPSTSTMRWAGGTPVFTPTELAMDTDYTLALWTMDVSGNLGEPVLVPFHTLLDTTPPAAPGGLAAIGGDYEVTATWTAPTDADLASQTAVLTDTVTGARTQASPLAKTAGTYTWPRLAGGRTFTVEVFATDRQGLTSTTVSAEVTTAPDTNGPPPAIPLSSISVTPASTRSVAVSFPRPVLPDLKTVGYEVRPLGAGLDPVGSVYALPLNSATVNGKVTLPEAMTAYQLVIHVWDLNGNRARTVIPSVVGAPNASELPLAPVNLLVSSPRDNTLDVTWGRNAFSVPVSTWKVTATSGSLTRTVEVEGSRTAVQLGGLVGRTTWQVKVLGLGTWGAGPNTTASPVTVGDTTAPQPVTAAKAVPSYDTDTLTWTNPADFDLDHVDVIRRGATAAETKLVYRGKGTTFRSTGLVAGRSYTYELRTYDAFGQTWSSFVRLDNRRSAPTLAGSTTIKYGSSTRVSGVLRFDGAPLAARKVTLFVQKYGTTTWAALTSATTTSTGAYAFTVKPSYSTRYRIGYVGAAAVGGAYSPVAAVSVAPTATMGASRTSLNYGGSVTLSTTIRPGHAGSTVTLQRWNGTAWATVTTRKLSSTSSTTAYVKPPARGTNKYRWLLPAHTDHTSGVSATASVRVY